MDMPLMITDVKHAALTDQARHTGRNSVLVSPIVGMDHANDVLINGAEAVLTEPALQCGLNQYVLHPLQHNQRPSSGEHRLISHS